MRRLLRLLRAGWALVAPLGRSLIAACLGSWLFVALWGWREFAVIAAICLVLLLTAVMFTLGRLDLSAELGVEPSRVVAGERAAGSLMLANRSGRTARGLRVELPVGKAMATYAVHKLGDEPIEELFVVPTQRRAIIPVGPVATVQGDPLGVLSRRRIWSEVEEIYVHPRTVALSTIAAGMIRDLEGQPTAQLSPSDVAFHTLREYVPGDDRRHVHWKSTAKLGKLLVRQYVDTRRSHVAVALSTDLAEYANEDEFELAVSIAASVAVQAQRDEQTLAVLVGSATLPSTAIRPMLDRFSGIEGRVGEGGLESLFQTIRTKAGNASVVVLCVGSAVDVAQVRYAAAKVNLETTTIVLRADLASTPRYYIVGTSRFVNVPDLQMLSRGLERVAS